MVEGFLAAYPGAYIVISHDRYFLDKVTGLTLELEACRLTPYKGNYSRYLELRQEHRLAQQRVYESTQREIQRIEGIIEQQRRWNQERNYVTIASKQKQIDRLAATLEKPPEEPDAIRFQFHASRRSGDEVLTAQGLSLSFGGPKLFENVDLEIRRGEKVFLIGPNGCGKTSLFKILLGQYAPDTGFVRLGAALDLGYYEQSQQSLHDEKTVMDEIWDEHPNDPNPGAQCPGGVPLHRGGGVQGRGGPLRRGAGPGAPVKIDALKGQLPAFGRAHQPPGHLLPGGAGRGPAGL